MQKAHRPGREDRTSSARCAANIARVKTVLAEQAASEAEVKATTDDERDDQEAARTRRRPRGQQQDGQDDHRLVERLVKHALYGKYMRRTTKLLAHDEDNASASEGDVVRIAECRAAVARPRTGAWSRSLARAQPT